MGSRDDPDRHKRPVSVPNPLAQLREMEEEATEDLADQQSAAEDDEETK